MKKFVTLCIALLLLVTLTACGNKQIFDTTYTYKYAIVKMPDGTILEGRLDKWSDYDGEQLQIFIDGRGYLVSSINTVLMTELP